LHVAAVSPKAFLIVSRLPDLAAVFKAVAAAISFSLLWSNLAFSFQI
jgi:hypothetical protein